MKILSLGLDNSILNKTSALASRTVEYGDLVDRYIVIVPGADKIELALSNKVKVYGSGGNNKLLQFFKIYYLAKKILSEEKYNIITVQDQYYLALIGLCLSKKFKLGLEIQVHGFEKYYGLRRLIAKYVLPRANAVRCVSQRLKKQLINELAIEEERITVVPIFVDTTSTLSLRASERSAFSPGLDPGNLTYSEVNQRLPARNASPRPQRFACEAGGLAIAGGPRRSDYGPPRNDIGVFIFLTVGRLAPVKNIGLQIKAMAEVVKKYQNTELWIIGDGADKEKLKLEIKNWKLEIKVKLLGWQNNLVDYYNQADAFLLTSNSEGWGMVVIEAASCGLPIIMTDVGCAGEVIINNESGLIIPLGDKEKLIEAMLKIIENENSRKKLGENAKLVASQLLSKNQILELYKKSWALALKK